MSDKTVTEPTYCPLHQHYKWCDHNGGVLTPNGFKSPAAAVNHFTVFIVIELEGGYGAIDGVYVNEADANRRRDGLNLQEGDPGFACVVAKYVNGSEGYLQADHLVT
jgi:hypothetical protein